VAAKAKGFRRHLAAGCHCFINKRFFELRGILPCLPAGRADAQNDSPSLSS